MTMVDLLPATTKATMAKKPKDFDIWLLLKNDLCKDVTPMLNLCIYN